MNSLPRTSRLRVVPLTALAATALAALAAAPAAQAYEGYGYQTIGGQGGSTCHVTTLAASGPGSLADCVINRGGARIVVFDVAGTISLGSTIYIDDSFLTIDGSTAPAPGITIRPASSSSNAIVLENAHDIIIQDLRLQGYDTQNGADLIGFDGDVGEIYNVVLDHLTFTGADDGAVDITNSVRDVTVSWCFFYNNTLTSLVKYGTRRRISYHHNVFARNGERNPQLQGDLKDFDYVNNIVYDWGRGSWGYGLRIRNVTSEGRVSTNVVNNIFVAVDTENPENGLIFGSNAGPDSEDGGPSGTPAQGTVVTTSDMGSLWVSGNVLPPENEDHYSTVSGAIPVPAGAQVTTWPASDLRANVLPGVGISWRTSAEQALLNEIARSPIPGTCSTIVVDPWSIPAATAGSAYLQSFTQIGGSGAIAWGLSGTLPAGLTFNTATGILSGTPTETGDFPITVTVTDANGCPGSRGYTLTVGPAGPFEAISLDIDAAGNSILEPGEVASLSPAWRNSSGANELLTGALTNFTGPGAPDPDYAVLDPSADYGTVGAGAAAACAGATGDCYSLLVSVPTSRPTTHWDAMARETLSNGQIKDWTVHVGESFDDVLTTHGFYPFVETLLHNAVTGGCSATSYCPTSGTTRGQMAVFVLISHEGPGYSPVDCVAGSEMFADVPAASSFCPFIEELSRRGVTGGCGGGNYCPTNPVTREQMPVFSLLTLEGSGYSPVDCVAGAEVFADVPAASPFCKWIEEFARRGITGGCGGGNYCPTNTVTRGQMAVFLTATATTEIYTP
jgi:pectate lyase